jgi:hypothetical protein
MALQLPVTGATMTQAFGVQSSWEPHCYHYGTRTAAFWKPNSSYLYATHFHLGTDWAKPQGTPILASEDGVVTYRGLPLSPGPVAGGGQTIEVKIQGGAHYVSCHCSAFAVGFGANVKRGQTIAYVGATGAATGPHDHFAVYTLDGYGRRLFYNPQLFMAGGALESSPLIRPSTYTATFKAYPARRKALIAGGATVHRWTPSHTGGPVGPDYTAPSSGSGFWVDGKVTYAWPGDSTPPVPRGEFLHGETHINPTTGKPYGGYFAGYGVVKGEVSAADHLAW